MVNGLFVEVLFRDDRLDDVFHEVGRDLFVGDVFGVLCGDDNGVHSLRDGHSVDEFVLAGDLRLAVGTDPFAGSVFAHFGELAADLRSEHVREGHEGLGLVGGVAKHDSLITGSNVFDLDGVYGLRNVGRLFFNGDNDVAGLVVESLGGVVVANVLDGVANDLFVVDGSRGGDFSKDHDHARLAARLARHTRHFVTGNASIEHRVGHLIAELVGMSFVDGFRSKEKGCVSHDCTSWK
mmetsp:Transcript_38949/g.101950  ORF Transcript_38949/g.101950 Transcript_38949/m.101950 type:complete len:237 (-) Transcript_38949:37-747(-)